MISAVSYWRFPERTNVRETMHTLKKNVLVCVRKGLWRASYILVFGCCVERVKLEDGNFGVFLF